MLVVTLGRCPLIPPLQSHLADSFMSFATAKDRTSYLAETCIVVARCDKRKDVRGRVAEKDRVRTDQFLLRLLPEEKAMLEKNAHELGLSKADYLRKVILYGSVIGQHPVMDKEQGRELLFEVNRIGNNINQIAYRSNVKRYTSNADWQEVKKECLDILLLLGRLVHMDREEVEEWQQQIYTQLQAQLDKQ